MEFIWSLSPRSTPFEARLREGAVIACGIFWCTFAIVGTVLGLHRASREVGLIAIGLLLLVTVIMMFYVVPLAECSNCTGPHEKQGEGT